MFLVTVTLKMIFLDPEQGRTGLGYGQHSIFHKTLLDKKIISRISSYK